MTDEKIIARMQADQQQGLPLCPRCGERMPDNPRGKNGRQIPLQQSC